MDDFHNIIALLTIVITQKTVKQISLGKNFGKKHATKTDPKAATNTAKYCNDFFHIKTRAKKNV